MDTAKRTVEQRSAVALLALLALAACGSAPRATEAPAKSEPSARFAAASDAEAWKRFSRETPPLPVWARTLAEALPRTTALQLDLDALHRTRNPLGAELAGKLRWTAADANRCAYAKEACEADLARAGLSAEQIGRLGQASTSEQERLALDFARKLSTRACEITDDEVAALIATYGPDDAVAIVHTVAHANFQQRIFLALGLSAEPGGARPPLEVGAASRADAVAPPRNDGSTSNASPVVVAEPSRWSAASRSELLARLEHQKARPPRVDKPDEARLARLPRPDRARVAGTEWGKVSMGYQPVLTTAWFQTMRSFEGEAALDEVFANSVFWVVTRANDCFY